MSNRPKLKTDFKNARSIAPLYTSGPVAATQDGSKIVTCIEESALLTDVSTGVEICRFAGDTETITSLCLSPSAKYLLVFTSSLSLRIFEVPTTTTPLAKSVHPIRVVPRAHEAPVHVCKTDPTSTYLASGSADGVVKVWDIARGFITHVFKGHGGVVSALAFDYHQDPSSVKQQAKMQLITASIDTRIRIFELTDSASRGKPVAVLEGHVSVPRGLDVSLDGKWLISGGRDSVVLVWDLSPMQQTGAKGAKGKGKVLAPTLAKTVPILERVEAVGLLRPDEDLTGSSSASDKLRFYTGGENGVVKIWDAREGNVLFTLGGEHNKISDDQETQRQIVDVMQVYLPAISSIISVHADQNIMFHSLSTHSLTRQLVGFNDEIVDARFLSSAGQRDSHLALATNSSLIRVYSVSDFDARLLEGHTEIVLCVDAGVNGTVLASGSKDKSARIWAPSNSSDANAVWGYGCVAVCEGHAESVGAISLSRQAGAEGGHPGFMFTGSQDRTIKMWDLGEVPLVADAGAEPVRCQSLNTLKAHEKDINALDVAPNDRLLVSGSQDRTANIYEIEYGAGVGGRAARGGLKLIGTCKGHKRGVWTVKFGRAERVLATGSGDKTVKLWSLDDFTCVKTFEGHTNSVLRVDFLNAGTQLVSSGSDGLVKLWNVKDEECATTLDNHQDKIWALAVSQDEMTVVSAAADSVVTFWQDCTEEQEVEKETKRTDLVLKEQDFLNYLELNDYRRAIQLAISMGQPGRLLSLFKDIRASAAESPNPSNSITGHPSVDEVIRTLGGSDLAKLLRYVRDWNAMAKTSIVAQGVLFAIVKLRAAEDVMQAFSDEVHEIALGEVGFGDEDEGGGKGKARGAAGAGGTALKEMVDGLIPYTERHLARMERLVQESYMVDYVLGEMDDGMFDGDDEGAMDIE
ncbi:U3 small nucleolar RNA-associated protein [Mycena alexandri]|uniref:U3 small nucleolar RNA-associated protein n=1 Tax=Mycena alexandri TaxID=1745969 RepID=A0AAD6X624_9AGAR|nr:U3 small nucleolar RNA-associated protein [Mycena alexandri]